MNSKSLKNNITPPVAFYDFGKDLEEAGKLKRRGIWHDSVSKQSLEVVLVNVDRLATWCPMLVPKIFYDEYIQVKVSGHYYDSDNDWELAPIKEIEWCKNY